jgi:hypothetical protein
MRNGVEQEDQPAQDRERSILDACPDIACAYFSLEPTRDAISAGELPLASPYHLLVHRAAYPLERAACSLVNEIDIKKRCKIPFVCVYVCFALQASDIYHFAGSIE